MVSRLRLGLFLILGFMFLYYPSLSFADVELKVQADISLGSTHVDMAFSRDGQWLYLLSNSGKLAVYTYNGQFKGSIEVGPGYDHIEAGPMQDVVYLLNSRDKSIRVVEVTADRDIDTSASPYKGNPDAPVVIAEFTDFQCPYCAKLGATFDKLLKRYPNKIKIVYKSYPLSNHRFAWKAATAAMAAHQKGQFWEFHDRLFEYNAELDEEKIMEIRKEFGFDTPDFDALMKSPEVRTQVAKDRNEGQQIGVRGTPSVFINGKTLKDKTLGGFREAIDKELKSLGQ